SPRYQLKAKPSRLPDAINFLSGEWLERYIKQKIIQLLNESNQEIIQYSYLTNPQISLPNGDDFELDIIFRINEEIFWFEVKTGEYQRHINKYSQMAQELNLDKDHAFMILTDIPDSATTALSNLFQMTVVNSDSFAEVFSRIISLEKNPPERV
ncbi:MAG: hypothetical protein SAK42_22365, partial [Oscillatoria sp. PMC 1076.18]|nr:hypothetical protein [Oscillatoria sp. PMC 1076.18]